VKNIKIFGYRGNSDGIDVNGSRDVDVSESYLRTGDDLIVVKSNVPGEEPTRHVTVERCVLWNEFAHALSLGAEMQKPVDNICFSDCDVIHDLGREWLLRIYQTDAARVSNVTFKDIRIEECREFISLWIGSAVWSRDTERGRIENITFQNITSPVPLQAGAPVEMEGFDAGHAIHGVKLDRIVVGGEPLKPGDVKQNPFVDGVRITP
jgi:polygalacturonase